MRLLYHKAREKAKPPVGKSRLGQKNRRAAGTGAGGVCP